MKQSRFIAMLPGAVLVFFLISCGGSGSTEKTATDTTTTATADTSAAPAVAAPANTIVTTPQDMVVITHKVANFAKWMAAFEGDDSARSANGLHKYVVGRGFMDSNIVIVALKADDIAKAKAFVKDPNLKKVMQKGGVTGAPMISYVTSTWRDTSDLSLDLIRSRTNFSVKDFDAWVKTFQDGKQERMDNGITDRTISHDVGDNKKVTLVTAVMDTAKAFAYYKSDALKKRREAGGVIGTPSRFLYRIIKRY